MPLLRDVSTRSFRLNGWLAALAFVILVPLPMVSLGQNTIPFSVNDAGVTKSVADWGVDAAWPNFDNVRQSIHQIGLDNVAAVRVLVFLDEPLVDLGGGDFGLTAATQANINNHLAIASMAGANVPLTFGIGGSHPGEINSDFVTPLGVNVTNYARVIKATQEYIHTRPGFTQSPIYMIEPYNEPDFSFVHANPSGAQIQQLQNDLNSVIQQLKTYPEFNNTLMMAPSVLNSNVAQDWYDESASSATIGSSHLLAGSLTTWTNFIEHVKSTGNPFGNPEIHSLAEMIVGAEHGMSLGMIWGDVLQGRGKFIEASDGDRLAYGVDFGNDAAGAVYRAPDGEVYAFAGGVERDYQGSPVPFRFVSTDQDVHFNGIPVREFMLQTKPDYADNAQTGQINDYANYGAWGHEGAYADVDLDGSGIPALDGHRWKIVSVQTGQVMEVVGGSTTNGGLIRQAGDTGALNQLWNINRTQNGYYQLFNAGSGRTAEVEGLSLNNGADVRQWGMADNQGQHWYIEEVGNGAFRIVNGHSNKYMTASSGNIVQQDLGRGNSQHWRFVEANPDPSVSRIASYDFENNALDGTGGNNGTLSGGPAFVSGFEGQALRLDGVNDFVSLPGVVASSEGITIAAWVNWDGGGDWQRLFDFGEGTSQYMHLTPRSSAGTMRFAIRNDQWGAEQILETDPLETGEWVHVALALGGNTGVLYLNGAPQVAGHILLNPTDFNSTNNFIGKSQFGNDPMFAGLIDDLQIFDRSLTVLEVAELVGIPSLRADLDFDGEIGAGDWVIFSANHLTDLSATQVPLTAALGDLDRDGDNDFDDFRLFQQDYIAANGPAAFSALFASVPEPSGVALLVIGAGGAAGRRRPRAA